MTRILQLIIKILISLFIISTFIVLYFLFNGIQNSLTQTFLFFYIILMVILLTIIIVIVILNLKNLNKYTIKKAIIFIIAFSFFGIIGEFIFSSSTFTFARGVTVGVGLAFSELLGYVIYEIKNNRD